MGATEDDAVQLRGRIGKAVIAILLAAGLAGATLPATLSYIERRQPIDYGTRPLVVFQIPAADNLTGIFYKWSTEKDHEVKLEYFVTADVDDPKGTEVSVAIIAGRQSAGNISCDTAGPTSSIPYPDLPEPIRNAAEIDRKSDRSVSTGRSPCPEKEV